MTSTVMVIVEGADFASALCVYLKTCCGFSVIEYDPNKQAFTDLLDRIVFDIGRVRLVILRGHLTAIAKHQINAAYFKEFEAAVALADAKLVLAVSEKDTANSGILADGYAHSWLEKRMYQDGDLISGLLEWLGLRDESRRAEASQDNVRSIRPELGAGLPIGRQSYANNRKAGAKLRNDGASAPSKRQTRGSKAGGG